MSFDDVPTALKPFYEAPFEQPIVLYEGRLVVAIEDGQENGLTMELNGQVLFRWRPNPDVVFRAAGSDIDPWTGFGGKRVVRVKPVNAVPAQLDSRPWTEQPPAEVTSHSGGVLPPTPIGDGGAVRRVLIHLVNLDEWRPRGAIRDERMAWTGRLTFQVDDWHITVDGLPNVHDELKALGGSRITHILEIRRHDDGAFAVDDTEDLRDALWHVLSFANGALVGFALPVGFDAEGRACWGEWSVTTLDRWRGRLSWFDSLRMVDDLEPLLHSWLRRAQNPFWASVLRRVVRIGLAANDPSPLDVAVIATQTALELLAWAVLVIDQRWLESKTFSLVDFDAPAKLRLLLRWAGIGTAVPAELAALKAQATARGLPDAPAAIVRVRNAVVHPPRRDTGSPPEWPTHEELEEAWRLGLEYLELLVLRLLDHHGLYGSRLHLEGRWPADVKGVPWAATKPVG